MKMFNSRSILTVLSLIIISTACDTSLDGELIPNQPPSTFLTVKEINRVGDDRLSSQISINWWGNDPDGYIVGYEYTFNDNTADSDWTYTERTDSIFVLPIPAGSDTADVVFRIRSIDNEDLRDPNPASLAYPIKNTPPTIEISTIDLPADTMYSFASIGWTAEDLDGIQNLQSIQFAINDTLTWYDLPVNIDYITFALSTESAPATTAAAFLGRGLNLYNQQVEGFVFNQTNEFIVRAIDQSGTSSPVDTVAWFIKQKTSNLLIINDFISSATLPRAQNYLNSLSRNGITSYDYWQFNNPDDLSTVVTLPRILTPQVTSSLAQWEYIVWVSDVINGNLNRGVVFLEDFLANNGSVLVFTPATQVNSEDPLTNLLPISGSTPLPQGENATNFRLKRNQVVEPLTDAAGAPNLLNETVNTELYPIVPSSGATALYRADFEYEVISFPFSRVIDFEGNETISAKSSNGRVVYFGIDISALKGQAQVDSLLHYLLVDELGFSSN